MGLHVHFRLALARVQIEVPCLIVGQRLSEFV